MGYPGMLRAACDRNSSLSLPLRLRSQWGRPWGAQWPLPLALRWTKEAVSRLWGLPQLWPALLVATTAQRSPKALKHGHRLEQRTSKGLAHALLLLAVCMALVTRLV